MATTRETDALRVPYQPQQVIDREQTLTFSFDGREYTAYEGDTIASALAAAGVVTFSRSFKYHRRRGLLCVSGDCPNCLVNVNGEPNVRSCKTPVTVGMTVEAQNAWPSRHTDVMSAVQLVGRFLPAGFYYKTFMRPPALWPVYEHVLRHAAGLGEVDRDLDPGMYDKIYRHTDVAVVGGGPAGLRAALSAAEAGARVLLLDDNPALGGHLRYSTHEVGGETAYDYAGTLAERVKADKNIEVMTDTLAFGAYDHGWIGAVQGERLVKVRATAMVAAAGAYENPLVFPNNDLPGIMLGSGAARLLHLWGVLPGKQAVVVSANPRGLRLALDLLNAGVTVSAVAELREEPESELVAVLEARGVRMLTGASIQQADGGRRVQQVTLQADGETYIIACDLLTLSTGYYPASGLLFQAGGRLAWDEQINEFTPETLPSSIFTAGEAAGTHVLADIEREGSLAGMQAAHYAGFEKETTAEQIGRLTAQVARARERRTPWTPPSMTTSPGKKDFVCFCEDVTCKEIETSIREGYDSVELLKRYSTVSMGPCQGKMCNMAVMRLCANHNKQTIQETGTTTSRPPVRPVTIGALGGRLLEPVRRTPMHDWHIERGAKMMNAGLWKRPEYYNDPHDEVRAVREAVGLIDISTLGKIHLQGSDVPELLDRLYTNRWQGLDVGRVRYGLMVNDEGIIMDDGVTARLADDFYYMTTTSSGATSVYEWIEWWLQSGWDLDVRVLNATDLRAALNLAGPRARDVLAKVTDGTDLNNEAFPYMRARQARVAGVPALLMRIGFTGELSYEIHVPAGYGLHVWEALLEAGADEGIQAFGIEAQRVLRLEKGHIIVGQDTDALTNPYQADMGWAVKTGKADFLGKPSLAMISERGPEKKLVGFTIPDGTLPEEANQIVQPGDGPLGLEIIGRVTSVRYSPTLDQVLGLCWLPAELAEPGMTFSVRVRGQLVRGRVTETPFYDPEAERLRM